MQYRSNRLRKLSPPCRLNTVPFRPSANTISHICKISFTISGLQKMSNCCLYPSCALNILTSFSTLLNTLTSYTSTKELYLSPHSTLCYTLTTRTPHSSALTLITVNCGMPSAVWSCVPSRTRGL